MAGLSTIEIASMPLANCISSKTNSTIFIT
jgi:hypothetical protein